MDVSVALELCQSFLVLAEELSFRRTAQRLGVDQSALTRRIQKLENMLGFALFERTTREVSLTPAGRAFYEANAGLLLGFSASVKTARRVAEGKTGTLRVGYMAFAALDIMPMAVARFRDMAPDVDIRMAYMRTQGQKLTLSDGSLDIGYMIGPFDHSEFHSLTVAVDRLCVFMPPDHALAQYEEIEPAQLADLPLILGEMSEWEAYRWRLDEMFASDGIKPQTVLEASNTLALIGLVRAGLGITVYPGRLQSILSAGLVSRPLADPKFRVETVLVWKRTNRTVSVRSFVEIARQLAKETDSG
ncbi:MAG: LysR family transcriptional regulator [Rhizobiaceae bacterium]|nr:LysR family transcriptional regulator [Rhizobiaceae bacterium]